MFGGKTDKPAPSGMEMMLRSMGMGPILDMGLQLANDGTLAKIVAFAENAEEILNTLRRVENELRLAREIRGQDGTSGDGAAGADACAGSVATGTLGSAAISPLRLVAAMPESHSGDGHDDAGRAASPEPARPATDNGARSFP